VTKAEIIASVSAVVAALAFILAIANFATGRATLALALFDRRMEVYEAVRKASTLAMNSEREFTENDGLKHLHKALNDARFLFGPEVAEHLNTLWKAGVELQVSRDSPKRKALDAYDKAYGELVDGTVKLQGLLRPYMSMDHKLPWRPIRKLFG